KPRMRTRPMPVMPSLKSSSLRLERRRPCEPVPYSFHCFMWSRSEGTKPTPKKVFEVLLSKLPAIPESDLIGLTTAARGIRSVALDQLQDVCVVVDPPSSGCGCCEVEVAIPKDLEMTGALDGVGCDAVCDIGHVSAEDQNSRSADCDGGQRRQ